LRKLAADLSETVQPIEALRATVRTLTEALRLPYAAITLEPGAPPVAMAGHPGLSEVPIPLTYQSQSVGELIVSPRTGSREFDATDRRLLEELAQQIGVVAHNVRLTNDLQTSRERIVTAREEERRRLRRDLHDGLGAQLAALTLQTGALKATIRTDPDAAVAQASELQHELRDAVADIRRLVQGLRPAALDDLGLIGALGARVATVNLVEWTESDQRPLLVALDAPDDLGPLPAAVEMAIYRIVDEALTNVVKHANASRCRVVLLRDPEGIRLTIEDDGAGIPADRISGVGLQSMRERALELGGTLIIRAVDSSGTRIVAELPVGEG
jgi:signal transduction histidine kinase